MIWLVIPTLVWVLAIVLWGHLARDSRRRDEAFIAAIARIRRRDALPVPNTVLVRGELRLMWYLDGDCAEVADRLLRWITLRTKVENHG